MTIQRDMLVELEDAKTVDSVEVQDVVNALPASPLLSVADVAGALNRSSEYVRGLVDSGELKKLPGLGKVRDTYQISR
ncbi:MAG: hypothetical protein PUH33_02695, partial [Clostridiaceae bacterium]|nr:hypothetical protein [Clostridiaceae bacterium]